MSYTYQNYSLPSSYRARNVIIGGDFSTNPHQRIATDAATALITGVTTAAYGPDRFSFLKDGAGTAAFNFGKVADAPTPTQCGLLTTYSMQVKATTAQPSLSAGQHWFIRYRVEGYDFASLAQAPATLSFWVKATLPGIYSVSILNSGADRSLVLEYTVNAASTWEYKTLLVPASPSAGTWDYTVGVGADIKFCIAGAVADGTSTIGSWTSSSNTFSANQVNGAATLNNVLQLNLIQLESGIIATPFEALKVSEVLALCQRYYEKSFGVSIKPQQALGSDVGAFMTVLMNITAAHGTTIPYKIRKRTKAAPTYTYYNPQSANNKWYNNTRSGDDATSGSAGSNGSEYGMNALTGAAHHASAAVGDVICVHWSADFDF